MSKNIFILIKGVSHPNTISEYSESVKVEYYCDPRQVNQKIDKVKHFFQNSQSCSGRVTR